MVCDTNSITELKFEYETAAVFPREAHLIGIGTYLEQTQPFGQDFEPESGESNIRQRCRGFAFRIRTYVVFFPRALDSWIFDRKTFDCCNTLFQEEDQNTAYITILLKASNFGTTEILRTKFL